MTVTPITLPMKPIVTAPLAASLAACFAAVTPLLPEDMDPVPGINTPPEIPSVSGGGFDSFTAQASCQWAAFMQRGEGGEA